MRVKLTLTLLFTFVVLGISACSSDDPTNAPVNTAPTTAKVIVTPTSGLQTDEDGAIAKFSVVLAVFTGAFDGQ